MARHPHDRAEGTGAAIAPSRPEAARERAARLGIRVMPPVGQMAPVLPERTAPLHPAESVGGRRCNPDPGPRRRHHGGAPDGAPRATEPPPRWTGIASALTLEERTFLETWARVHGWDATLRHWGLLLAQAEQVGEL